MATQNTPQGPNRSNSQPPERTGLAEVLEQSAPRQLSRTTMILWLVAISMLVFFLPLYLFSGSVSEDVKGIEADLGFIRMSLTRAPTPVPAIQKLLTPLGQVQGQLNQLNSVYPTLAAARPDWPTIMAVIGNYDPDQITLTSITRTVNSLTLSGRASNDSALTTYAHALRQSDSFSRVVVQSIRTVAITPTATLTRTNPITPTLTATNTPTPRDQFEPDDSQPQPIALGQPQSHNFYPDNDVDAVSFLAKTSRYYHVYTTELALGVDTFLSVRVGGLQYDNDDARPASLYSSIVFQHTGSDTTATVTVSNRGIYGPDKTYKIVVEEVVATPTPIPTNTPPPAPTNTSVPPPTPTTGPTATPDQRDAYETDDTNPKSIAVGETQTHNFYPNGDSDKVSFVVKNGRYYQVLTSNLALGVDTIVTVVLGNQQWVNDDYATGSGNFASVVCFQAFQDGTAVATIANNALQYGSTKTYQIKVSEVQSLTASPCVPITPIPAGASPHTKKIPGLAVLIRSGISSLDRANDQSIYSTMLEFVIIVELKGTTP